MTLTLAAQELLAPLFADDPDSFIVDVSAVFMRNAAQVVKCHDERAFLEGTEVGMCMSNFCVCICDLLNEVSIPLCLACNTLLGQIFCGGARALPPPRGAGAEVNSDRKRDTVFVFYPQFFHFGFFTV
jgi:hypothetical protein